MVFKECNDRDDAFKLGLVYFAEAVLIRVKNNISVNLDYLNLVEDMDNLSFAASKIDRGRKEEEVKGIKRVICVAFNGDDVDVVIPENLTFDTNDVGELIRVSFARLAHEKEISDMILVKKVEELLKVVEELRSLVKKKHVEENTKEEEEEGKMMWEKKLKGNEKMKKREKKMKRQNIKKQKKKKEIKRRKKKKTKLLKLVMVGLVGERPTEEYEDVTSLDDDNEEVIYTPEGQHMGTKRKVSCKRAMSKSV
ncbi:hypothetical protein DVH24_042727 [Malus domestica]|uniref:Uncharacterized protein n=1 Tax=Malus domestica TaxID=3750 RepID=A0A498HYN6_MALDO|nr:hypothetical protein DVH24_042727 [Malus domestica]